MPYTGLCPIEFQDCAERPFSTEISIKPDEDFIDLKSKKLNA